jgi:hypothetical protein
VSLSGWGTAQSLYLARADEVSEHRPLFTGDVIRGASIGGVPDADTVIIIAHPCAMRAGPRLSAHVLAAAVRPHAAEPSPRWTGGFFNRMPLPELDGAGTFHGASLEEIGLVETEELENGNRIACLSTIGVNMLQQRLVYYLTRLEIETSVLWEAFAHTYEESDLLEEWAENLSDVEPSPAVSFDAWMREGSPIRQERLKDAQHRAPIRAELRAEINRRKARSIDGT